MFDDHFSSSDRTLNIFPIISGRNNKVVPHEETHKQELTIQCTTLDSRSNSLSHNITNEEIEKSLQAFGRFPVDLSVMEDASSLLRILKRKLKMDSIIIIQGCLARRIYNSEPDTLLPTPVTTPAINTVPLKSKHRHQFFSSYLKRLHRSNILQEEVDHLQEHAIKHFSASRVRGFLTQRILLDHGKIGTVVCASSTPCTQLTSSDEVFFSEMVKAIEDIYYQRQAQRYQMLRSQLALINGLVLSLRTSLQSLNQSGKDVANHWMEIKALFTHNNPVTTPRRRQSQLIGLAVTGMEGMLRDMQHSSDDFCEVIERSVMVAKGYLAHSPGSYMRSCAIREDKGFVATLNEYLLHFNATLPLNTLLWTFKTENFFSTCAHTTYYHHLLLFLENIIFHWSAICSTVQLTIVFEDGEQAHAHKQPMDEGHIYHPAHYGKQPPAGQQLWKLSDRAGFDHCLLGNIAMTLQFSDEFAAEEMSFPMEILAQILSLLNSSLSRLSQESAVQITPVRSFFQPKQEEAYVIRVPCTMYFTDSMYEAYEHHRRVKQHAKLQRENTMRFVAQEEEEEDEDEKNTSGHTAAPSMSRYSPFSLPSLNLSLTSSTTPHTTTTTATANNSSNSHSSSGSHNNHTPPPSSQQQHHQHHSSLHHTSSNQAKINSLRTPRYQRPPKPTTSSTPTHTSSCSSSATAAAANNRNNSNSNRSYSSSKEGTTTSQSHNASNVLGLIRDWLGIATHHTSRNGTNNKNTNNSVRSISTSNHHSGRDGSIRRAAAAAHTPPASLRVAAADSDSAAADLREQQQNQQNQLEEENQLQSFTAVVNIAPSVNMKSSSSSSNNSGNSTSNSSSNNSSNSSSNATINNNSNNSSTSSTSNSSTSSGGQQQQQQDHWWPLLSWSKATTPSTTSSTTAAAAVSSSPDKKVHPHDATGEKVHLHTAMGKTNRVQPTT